MNTEILRPNGTSQYQLWTGIYEGSEPSSNNHTHIDEATTNDFDLVMAWNRTNDTWGLDYYTLPAHSIPADAEISKVNFYARLACKAGRDYATFVYKSGGTAYWQATPNITASFAEYSWERTTNQKTGLAWTRDDITNLLVGVACYFRMDEYKSIYVGQCSQLWIEVHFTGAAAGGWTHITKVNGIASANIAKVNGIAVANIAKVNGIAV